MLARREELWNSSSAGDPNVLEIFKMEILSILNSVIKMIKEWLTLNF